MEDSEPIMISALNHFLYCPRRCALVHVEQIWSENIFTMRGNNLHENVHDDSSHEIAGVRLERALPVWSKRLNLTGKTDLVEFHDGIPYPVEYKSGRKKTFENDFAQLCAQALCLEEMFDVPVKKGALYWHGSRERREIVFTDTMRRQVEEVTALVAEMLNNPNLPPPVNDKRCEACSLKESCLPSVVAERQRFHRIAGKLFNKE